LTTVFEAGLDVMVLPNMLLCCDVVSLSSGARLEEKGIEEVVETRALK
jgi:hypothetical protein